MERIYPLDRSACSSYVGRRVCAVLQDGSQVVAMLSGVDENGIILNGEIQRTGKVSQVKGRGSKSRKSAKDAKTSVVGYGFNPGFGPGAFFISWALLALLFAFPFF